MTVTTRGRICQDGPYTFCGNAGWHPQPCMCVAPPASMRAMPALSSLPQDPGCYWHPEDPEERP